MTKLQQIEGELRDAAHDGFDVVSENEMLEVVVQVIFDKISELLHVLGSRAVDDGDGVCEIVMAPDAVLPSLTVEFLDGKVVEPVDLVLDSHREDFRMFGDEVLQSRWSIVCSADLVDTGSSSLTLLLLQHLVDEVFHKCGRIHLGSRGSHSFVGIGEVVEVVEVVHHELHNLWVIANIVDFLRVALGCFKDDSAAFSLLSQVSTSHKRNRSA